VKNLTKIAASWGHIPNIPIPYKSVSDVNDTLQERAQYQCECGDVASPQL
jgi:hypothetical protein